MKFDRILTDFAGVSVMLIGLISLTESLLQVQIIGNKMPLTQGTMISLFTVSFGAVLMTENATKAFEKFRVVFSDKLRD